MYSESNTFKRTIQLNRPVKSNIFKITRNKKDKSYLLLDDENKLLLQCKYTKNNYCIYDMENIKIAEIIKEGRKLDKFNKIYYLYFQKKENKQIIGLHQIHNKEFKQYNIPCVYDYNNGINSFRDIKHMNLTDHTTRKRIKLESYPFKVSINFSHHIKSIKNSYYYLGNSLKYELVKESTNNFNLYLDNPLSLIQGFMLALVNIRI